MKRAEQAADEAEADDEGVVGVRQVLGEGERHDGLHAHDLGDEEVRGDGGAHDRDDEGRAELAVNLLQREEDAGEGGVEGRRHARRGAAGHEKPLLSPLPAECA